MAISSIPTDRRSARIAIVEQHIRLENQHDLEGVLDTFGANAHYDDGPWDEHFNGRDGVRQFYEQLMKALPDLEIKVQRQHVTEDAILVEVVIRGTHLGSWRGLPATGRRIEFPVFTPSTPMIVWLEKKSTTIAEPYSDSSAFFTNPRACWDKFLFS
jgi:steroid delta-isomerase-like uncharacterized protein